MTRTAIYLFVFALIASAMVGVAGATAPNPTYGTAVVDGSTGDWNLGSDFFANMYRAGNPAKPLESTAYLRYDCATGTVYVLVLSAPNVPTLTWPDDAWVKINGGKAVDGTFGNDGTPPDFSWVGLSQDGQTAGGTEASFPLAPGTYSIDIHVQVFNDNEEQTSRLEDVLSLVLTCVPPTETPTPTLTEGRTYTPTPTATDGHGDRNGDRDGHGDRDRNGNGDGDGDGNCDGHADADDHRGPHLHADPDSDRDADRDRNRHADADDHRGPHLQPRRRPGRRR